MLLQIKWQIISERENVFREMCFCVCLACRSRAPKSKHFLIKAFSLKTELNRQQLAAIPSMEHFENHNFAVRKQHIFVC